jgi:hypothetical protein
MSDLIERYVHEVGRYVPQKERADIQAELRSQIHDQLEDRYEGAPTTENVAEVLKDLGKPRRMATSYGGEQYLIGPDLYPVMMMVLRRGWVVVPPIVVLVNVIVALFGGDTVTFGGLVVQTFLNVMQALWILTGVVVVIFAILQHSGEDLDEITGQSKVFDPYALPEIDDPAGIDRVEASFGVAIGTFFTIVLIYYLRVGGLTLRFNLGDPGEVLPVPVFWLVVLILAVVGQVVMNLVALRRNRWSVGTLLLEATFEVVGAFGLYYAVLEPLWAALLDAVPALANVPFIGRGPEVFLAAAVVISLISGVTKIIKLLTYRRGATPSYKAKAGS